MHEPMIGRSPQLRQRSGDPNPLAWLLVCAAGEFNAQAPLSPDRSLVLGREPGCDLILPYPRISRRHALVQREVGGYVIRDLGSLYGVHVNNRRVTACRLRHNDLIELADTRLIFIAA